MKKTKEKWLQIFISVVYISGGVDGCLFSAKGKWAYGGQMTENDSPRPNERHTKESNSRFIRKYSRWEDKEMSGNGETRCACCGTPCQGFKGPDGKIYCADCYKKIWGKWPWE